MSDDIVIQITARRLSRSPYYDIDITKASPNEIENLKVLGVIAQTIKRTLGEQLRA